jgi:hypothetical protein
LRGVSTGNHESELNGAYLTESIAIEVGLVLVYVKWFEVLEVFEKAYCEWYEGGRDWEDRQKYIEGRLVPLLPYLSV